MAQMNEDKIKVRKINDKYKKLAISLSFTLQYFLAIQILREVSETK